MRASRHRHHRRQRGVAVITALLLTTLAITIVASLFWQQQVQVRSIENQRLQLQKQWVLRGALDWSRLILREDARHSSVDHLGEPWAVPLAETRLDEYVENGQSAGEAGDATLSGGIVDAQSRFNLANLRNGDGTINEKAVAAFARLLSITRQNPALARATADLMAAARPKPASQNPNNPNPNNPNPNSTPNPGSNTAAQASGTSSSQPLDILSVDDLLAVPDFTPQALAAIRDFVVVLPQPTSVNVNTAPPEVLAAIIDTLSLPEAAALVANRETTWFKNIAEFTQRLQGKSVDSADGKLDVRTSYFLVNGNVHLNRAGMQMQALVERSAGVNPTTKVIWIRES